MVAAIRHEGLGRARRLRQRAEFLAVQRRGLRAGTANYMLFALQRGDRDGPARVGVTVTKKVGKATVRNRVKRWVRECYRRAAHLAPRGVDIVLIARPSAAAAGHGATSSEIRALLGRLGRS